MSMTVRGGLPYARRVTAPTTGRRVSLPAPLLHLIVRNVGAVAAKLYFSKSAYDDDGDEYVEVPVASATLPYGEWAGPVETEHASSAERGALWLRGDGGSATVELVMFARRG